MSRNRKPRDTRKYENSLSDLALNLGRAEGMTTGGSFLSAYNTIAHSNNYSLITLNRIILTYLYAGNGIFQTAIQLPIQDAIGKGIEIDSGELSNEDIDDVLEYWEEKGIWDVLLNAWTWGRLYGGAAILVNTNQDPETELVIRGLQNSPLELYDIDRWQLDTNAVIFDDWGSYLDGSGEYIYLEGEKIHKSRFLRIAGKRAPHYVRRQLRGWGMSEGERMVRDLNLYLKTQDATYEIIDEAKIDVYKINGLAQKMMTAGGTSKITQRVQAANEIKNYINALVLDANEEYEQKQINFGGLAEVMNQNRIGVAAALRMPLTKLFGLSASGFNTGQSDLENYNAMVESEIRRPMRPIIRKLLQITMAKLFGYVPSFTFTYPSLREMTPEAEQNVKTQEFNRAVGLYDRGLLDSKEIGMMLRKSGVIDIETKAEQGLLPSQPKPPEGGDMASGGGNAPIGQKPKSMENSKKKSKIKVRRNRKKITIRTKAENEEGFEESKHKRDKSGKFTKGGGGGESKKDKDKSDKGTQKEEPTKSEPDNYIEYMDYLKEKYEGESIWAESTDQELQKLEKLEKEYYKEKDKQEESDKDGQEEKKKEYSEKEKLALDSFVEGYVPEGWYLHGRNADDINTGRQVQFSKNWSTATGYATDEGNVFMVKPDPEDTVDMRDKQTREELAKKFIEDYEEGTLEGENDEIAQNLLSDTNGDIEEAIERLSDSMNPLNIGDSAGFFDATTNDPYIWLFDKTGKTFFVTEDGAVDISGEAEQNIEESVKLSTKELEEYFDENV